MSCGAVQYNKLKVGLVGDSMGDNENTVYARLSIKWSVGDISAPEMVIVSSGRAKGMFVC